MTALRAIGQGLTWLVLLAPVIIFAQWPWYSPLPAGHGELKLSVAHTTQRLRPCRQLGAAELRALPPNMRNVEQCERGRVPALLQVALDDRLLLDASIEPGGLHSDGRVYLQRSWALPAGRYALYLALRDSPREQGFDREQRFDLELAPGDSVLLKVGDGASILVAPGATPARNQPQGVKSSSQPGAVWLSKCQRSKGDTQLCETKDLS